jgi:hypothetical protein
LKHKVWELFESWYGGGPAISFVGPPSEDSRRWAVHVYEKPEVKTEEKLVDLFAKIERPDDVVHEPITKSANGKSNPDAPARIAVKLHGGRKPSLAELTLMARAGDFHDGGEDLLERPLSMIEDEDGDDDDEDTHDEAAENNNSENEDDNEDDFAPLTKSVLNKLNFGHDNSSVGGGSIGGEERASADFSLPPEQKESFNETNILRRPSGNNTDTGSGLPPSGLKGGPNNTVKTSPVASAVHSQTDNTNYNKSGAGADTSTRSLDSKGKRGSIFDISFRSTSGEDKKK